MHFAFTTNLGVFQYSIQSNKVNERITLHESNVR
jgi:hypothetical protein